MPRGSPVAASSSSPIFGSPLPGGGSGKSTQAGSGGSYAPSSGSNGGGGGGNGHGDAGPLLTWRPLMTSSKASDRWRLRVGLLLVLGMVTMVTILLLGIQRGGRTAFSPGLPVKADQGSVSAVGTDAAARGASADGSSTCSGGTSGEVNIAYFIQVSESNLPLLLRLLRSLAHPANAYAVHFDRKIPDAVLAPVVAAIRADDRLSAVQFMPREVVTYRGISMVLNVLSAMEFLLATHPGWCYFINISAADYPLASQTTVRRLLATPGVVDAGANFASVSSPQKWVDTVTEQRIGRLFVDTSLAFGQNGTAVVAMKVPNPLYAAAAWTARKSEAWMVLHRDFVTYTVRSAAARRLLLAFSLSIEASEHYFVTLLTNTARWRRTLITSHLRLVVWAHRGVKAVQHPYYVDEMEPDGTGSAYAFADQLMSSNALFARKFRVPDSPLLDTLDRSVSGIAPSRSAADAAGVVAATERVRDGLARAMAHSASQVAAWERRLATAAAAGRLPAKEDQTPLDEPEEEIGVVNTPDEEQVVPAHPHGKS
ncbi:hypothetical protein MMPV_008389 [Pyropia vietnamensis]